jgi:hypothetical protein
MRAAREGLQALHGALVAQGGPVADALLAPPASGLQEPGPAQVASAGPRAASAPGEYELLIEMILEGSRLHYGEPALVAPEDPDLRLLLGDQLYALGLQRLAELGDLQAVAELADLISLVAQAHAEGDPGRVQAIWAAGMRAIGWGADGAHEAVKAGLRAATGPAYEARRATPHRDER